MNKILLVAASAVILSGCTGTGLLSKGGSADQLEILRAVNAHIEGCDRHYQGNTGPMPSLSFNVDCKARPVPGAVTPEPSPVAATAQ